MASKAMTAAKLYTTQLLLICGATISTIILAVGIEALAGLWIYRLNNDLLGIESGADYLFKMLPLVLSAYPGVLILWILELYTHSYSYPVNENFISFVFFFSGIVYLAAAMLMYLASRQNQRYALIVPFLLPVSFVILFVTDSRLVS